MDALRVVFMGSDAFSVPALRALLREGSALPKPVEVVALATQPDRPAGRGRLLSSSPPKLVALEHGIPVLQPERIRRPEARAEVLAYRPDLIIVASFGQILPRELLDVPIHGCLNLHPSLLPLYRGPAPIAGPILSGDTETGTTIMLMSLGMDEGPILAQVRTPLGEDESAGELERRLADMSAQLLLLTLPNWIEEKDPPVPQDSASASYTRLLKKEDGAIDWRLPALIISRRVRAYNPWPSCFTHWGNNRLRVLKAQPTSGQAPPGLVVSVDGPDTMCVGTGDGLLRLLELQPAGGRAMAADTFMRGNPVAGSYLS